MADKTFAETLTDEQKPLFEAEAKTLREAAVNEYKTTSETERKKLIPEKYEFTFADKSPLDPKTDAEALASYAKSLGLTKEQTADYVKHHETLVGGVLARQQEAFKQTSAKWADDVKADKDLGGGNYDASLAHAKRAMDKFAPDGSKFRQMLNETGYGNHPEFVRFVVSIGQAMAEDKTILGDGTPKQPQKDLAERLFPGFAAK